MSDDTNVLEVLQMRVRDPVAEAELRTVKLGVLDGDGGPMTVAVKVPVKVLVTSAVSDIVAVLPSSLQEHVTLLVIVNVAEDDTGPGDRLRLTEAVPVPVSGQVLEAVYDDENADFVLSGEAD